jgi:site-specific DNA-methyltransferase (adenine-specific)
MWVNHLTEIQLYHGDCLEVMGEIPDQSIDLILCDLPYGTTACLWDCPIDLDVLWEQYKRIIKPNNAILLTTSQPFTTVVISSNIEWFKYEWIWLKNRPTNFAHAKNKPMKKHENILVFSEGTTVHASQSKNRMPYYPQGLVDTGSSKKITKKMSEKTDAFFSDRPGHTSFVREKTGYPSSILEFSTDQLGLHPTAKPVALMEYLIRTYTNPGETVLDNCMGSGSTGVAAIRSDRKFIGIEMDEKYFEIASSRIFPYDNLPLVNDSSLELLVEDAHTSNHNGSNDLERVSYEDDDQDDDQDRHQCREWQIERRISESGAEVA